MSRNPSWWSPRVQRGAPARGVGRRPSRGAVRELSTCLSAQLPPLAYPGHFLVKRVTHAGTIRFQDRLLFLANALKEHHVGLEESDDGVWSLYLGAVLLGKIDEATMRVYG